MAGICKQWFFGHLSVEGDTDCTEVNSFFGSTITLMAQTNSPRHASAVASQFPQGVIALCTLATLTACSQSTTTDQTQAPVQTPESKIKDMVMASAGTVPPPPPPTTVSRPETLATQPPTRQPSPQRYVAPRLTPAADASRLPSIAIPATPTLPLDRIVARSIQTIPLPEAPRVSTTAPVTPNPTAPAPGEISNISAPETLTPLSANLATPAPGSREPQPILPAESYAPAALSEAGGSTPPTQLLPETSFVPPATPVIPDLRGQTAPPTDNRSAPEAVLNPAQPTPPESANGGVEQTDSAIAPLSSPAFTEITPRPIRPIEATVAPENAPPEAVLDEAIAAPPQEISDPTGATVPISSGPISTVPISTVTDANSESLYASTPAGTPTAPFEIASLPMGIPATAVDGTYTLGAGDRVRMDVMNVPEYSGERQVLVDGSLSLPLVGNVRVDGMTMEQASSVIAERYRPLVRGPVVSLTLVQPRPLRVSIAGEVVRPGSYNLTLSGDRQFPSVVQAIQAAQGLTQAANLRQVQVQRPQRGAAPQLITVNLWELLQNGDLRQDLTLRDGDSILIPASRQVNLAEANQLSAANFSATAQPAMNVAIVGEVQRPGTHRLEVKGEAGGQPTLTQAIQTAGGITATADLRQVQVRRPTRSGSPQLININLWQLLQSGDVQQDLALQQGDTIVIPTATAMTPAEATQLASASFSPSQINVSVVGEVNSPGRIAVAPNTPLNQALLTAGGFNRRAGRSVELVRLNPNGTVTRQRIEVDLAQNVSDQRNPLLRNNDVLLVGRSGAARFSDGLESVLGPIFRILPLVGLF